MAISPYVAAGTGEAGEAGEAMATRIKEGGEKKALWTVLNKQNANFWETPKAGEARVGPPPLWSQFICAHCTLSVEL